jgi:hypothetical protein
LRAETTKTQNYLADGNALIQTLITLGFSEELAIKAQSLINGTGTERKIKLIKLGTEGKMQVKIEITLTNDTNETELKVIEVIPKEFTDSARKIISSSPFTILKDDPTIQFDINLAKSAKTTISYGLGDITAEEANKIIDGNVIGKFLAPPIILGKNDEAKKILSGGLFGLDTNTFIIIIIILAIVIITGILFIKFPHPGHKMGGEKTVVEHLTPEKEPEKPKWSAP